MKKLALIVLIFFCQLTSFLHALPTDSFPPREFRHAVKISLISVVAGDLSVHYEQRFCKRFPAEIGIGRTWTNIVQQYFDLFTRDLITPPDKYGFGWSFKGQLRYYPMKEERAILGSYIALEFGKRNHVMQFDYTTAASGSAQVSTTNERMNHGALLIGLMDNGEKHGHALFDFHIGLGLRQTTWFDTVSQFILSPDFKSISFSPVLLIGLKIGWGW